jgi:F0F1-type ATP synthase assembly protein I
MFYRATFFTTVAGFSMTTQNPSLGSSILVFTGAFILLAVIVNVVLWVLVTYAGMSSESGGALGWMPPIVGAMMAGQHYGKRVGAKPPQGRSWAAGFAFAIITMAFMALSFYIVFAAMSGPSDLSLQGLLDEMGANLFFGVVAGFVLLLWVLQRFTFSFGAGQAVKMAAIQAARQKG